LVADVTPKRISCNPTTFHVEFVFHELKGYSFFFLRFAFGSSKMLDTLTYKKYLVAKYYDVQMEEILSRVI
jgi:hypothetical protein